MWQTPRNRVANAALSYGESLIVVWQLSQNMGRLRHQGRAAVVGCTESCANEVKLTLTTAQLPFHIIGAADIFRGIMVSLYVKGKENGHIQAYAPTGAMGLKRWGGLTSKLDGLPIASDPHLWWQACP